jgi:hypothetical protein
MVLSQLIHQVHWGQNVIYIKNLEQRTTIAEEVVRTTMPLQIAASL